MTASLARTECDAWNANHRVGDLVTVTRDDGSEFQTHTKSPAWVIPSGDALVGLEGVSGGYLLIRVRSASVAPSEGTANQTMRDYRDSRMSEPDRRRLARDPHTGGTDGE